MFRRKRSEEDFAEEIRAHLELEADELKDEGVNQEEAQRRARVAFGSVSAAQERFNLQGRLAWLDNFAQDVRFALRQLRRRPGFAVTAILILALGMGVSVAIFGFVDAALLEPLPYAQPNRLVAVTESAAMVPWADISFPDYQDWTRMNKSFSSLAVYTGTGYLLRTGSGTEPVQASRVSDGLFARKRWSVYDAGGQADAGAEFSAG